MRTGVSQTFFRHAHCDISSLVMNEDFPRCQSEEKHIQYQTGPNTKLNCAHFDEEVTCVDIRQLEDGHRRF